MTFYKISYSKKIIVKKILKMQYCTDHDNHSANRRLRIIIKHLNVFMLFICVVFLSGCATKPVVIACSVDSLASPGATTKKRYIILSGQTEQGNEDLQFQEFAKYIDKALLERNFLKVINRKDADIIIFVYYSVSNPQTYTHSYVIPTYGQTGVSSSHSTGTVSSYGGYSQTTTYTPTYGITGYIPKTDSYTIFNRCLLLSARENSSSKCNQIWRTSVTSTGSSNDLRLIIPYMITAMKPYIGTSTNHKIDVDVPIVNATKG